MDLTRFIGHGLRAFLHAAACAFAVVLMLSFPASSVHHFDQRFRTIEFRQKILRHTFMADSGEDGVQKAKQLHVAPVFHGPVAINLTLAREIRVERVPATPIIVVLQRFKLGPSRSAPTDPLI